MAQVAAGLDEGSGTVRALVLGRRKDRPAVLAYRSVPAGNGLEGLGLKGRACVLGLGGRDVILRYAQVPPVPDWQLRNLVAFEVAEIASSSGDALCADFNLLPGSSAHTGEDTVLIALTREAAAAERQERVQGAGGRLAALCPGPVALYNALLLAGEAREGETCLAACLGRETMDVVLARGTDLLFARNLSGGGKVFDQAIAQTFNVRAERAESIKHGFANVDPGARDRYASTQEEKVSRAVLGAAGQLVSALRSTVAFCQSQTGLRDLKIDRILICGGTSRLKGLPQLLTESFRCPVDRLDPFQADSLDLGGLPPAERERLLEESAEAVPALGLAAGWLQDDLYKIEILPEKVRRRREFLRGPLYAWMAAGVGLLFLGLSFARGSTRFEALDAERQQLAARVANVQKVDKSAVDLEQGIARNLALLQAFEDLGGRSAALLKTWEALAATLPQEFWVKSIAVERPKSAAGGRKGEEPRPQVTIRFLGKESGQQEIALERMVEPFMAAFQEKLAGPVPVPRATPRETDPVTKTQLFAFEVTLDYLAQQGKAAGPGREE